MSTSLIQNKNRLTTEEIINFKYGDGPLSRSNSKGILHKQQPIGNDIRKKQKSIMEMKLSADFDQSISMSKSPSKMNMTSIDSIYNHVG